MTDNYPTVYPDSPKGHAIKNIDSRVQGIDSRVAVLEGIDESTGGPTVAAELAMDNTSPPTATAGQGVVLGSGAEGQVTQLAVAAMAVRVQTGGTGINNQGAEITIPTSTSLAVAASDVTNPRQDVVVVTAAGALAVRTGTPAGSPADPTLTAGDIPLARLAVAANATTVVTGNITDLRSRKGVTGAKLTTGSVPTAALAAGAATLVKQAVAGKKTCVFRGKASAGAITGVTGLVVGDRVESVTPIGTAADKLLPVLSANTGTAAVTQPAAAFEAAITVNDQIQQASGSDLSANLYLLVAVPAAS